jgi:hypothetical protein
LFPKKALALSSNLMGNIGYLKNLMKTTNDFDKENNGKL